MWRNEIDMFEDTHQCNIDKLFVFALTVMTTQLVCIQFLYQSCKSGSAKLDEVENEEDSDDESIVENDKELDISLSLKLQSK